MSLPGSTIYIFSYVVPRAVQNSTSTSPLLLNYLSSPIRHTVRSHSRHSRVTAKEHTRIPDGLHSPGEITFPAMPPPPLGHLCYREPQCHHIYRNRTAIVPLSPTEPFHAFHSIAVADSSLRDTGRLYVLPPALYPGDRGCRSDLILERECDIPITRIPTGMGPDADVVIYNPLTAVVYCSQVCGSSDCSDGAIMGGSINRTKNRNPPAPVIHRDCNYVFQGGRVGGRRLYLGFIMSSGKPKSVD